MQAASQALTQMRTSMKDFDIEQGPALLRLLAFAASAYSFGCAVLMMVTSIKTVTRHPVNYIVTGYIAVFAASTMLFEAKHEWIEKIPGINKYQDMLIQYCSFMTLVAGRGVFYIFQATLWLTYANSLSEILFLAAAAAQGFVGVLHLFAHWGLFPNSIASKAIATVERVKNNECNE